LGKSLGMLITAPGGKLPQAQGRGGLLRVVSGPLNLAKPADPAIPDYCHGTYTVLEAGERTTVAADNRHAEGGGRALKL